MMNDRKNNCFHFYSDRKSKEKISNFMHIGNTIQKLISKLIYLFMAVLGLCCCTWAFSSCSERELLSSCRSSAWVFHCNGLSCCGSKAVEHVGFNSCGARA